MPRFLLLVTIILSLGMIAPPAPRITRLVVSPLILPTNLREESIYPVRVTVSASGVPPGSLIGAIVAGRVSIRPWSGHTEQFEFRSIEAGRWGTVGMVLNEAEEVLAFKKGPDIQVGVEE